MYAGPGSIAHVFGALLAVVGAECFDGIEAIAWNLPVSFMAVVVAFTSAYTRIPFVEKATKDLDLVDHPDAAQICPVTEDPVGALIADGSAVGRHCAYDFELRAAGKNQNGHQ